MTISIVLYGRNDNYGYNLHKRAALSLNCMAEVLTDSADEILFVDYNTPDDFPTFPEAIQDTLTKRAREVLRILRVRPHIHERFKSHTRLMALEPVARNVAVRRSCPTNRWILSTNTDMIFVPRSDDSLSQTAQSLDPGFYHAPRIEIPEVLWESLDRHSPSDVITTVREWGSSLYLNEIILGAEFIRYDGPGDFQLLLRDDLFANHGFHEGMLLGWHVDSNIAKRMYLKYRTVGDLGKQVYGYHCDHTRQVTPAHSHTRVQNDWRRFCHEVDSPDVPKQADTWGCANDEIDEVRLAANPARIYVQALREAIGSPLTEPQIAKYTHETYNKVDYDPRHVVPFLADMFASMPKSCTVAWYGGQTEILSRFAAVWDRLSFSGKILVDPELLRPNDLTQATGLKPAADGSNTADAFVFDFGSLPGSSRDFEHNKKLSGHLLRRFLAVVREERKRSLAGSPPRRLIALNAINNKFERLVTGYVAAAATPSATHMRHGFVLPAKSREDWLPLVVIGQAGVRVGDCVNTDPRKLGVITSGPFKYLDAGYYRLKIEIVLASEEHEYNETDPCIVIEVHAGAKVLGAYLLRRSALRTPEHEFHFAVSPTAVEGFEGIEARIMSLSRVALSIRHLSIESMSQVSDVAEVGKLLLSPPLELEIDNWLPYLSLGPLGHADDVRIIAQSGPSDYVAFGPYWPLPAGYYEAVIHIECDSEGLLAKTLVKADVMTGDEQLVALSFRLDARCAKSAIRLPFEMRDDLSEWRQIETRIWSSGEESFRILSLSVKSLDQSQWRDLLRFLLLGEKGRRVGNAISSIGSGDGLIAYSPTMGLKSGNYRITFAVEARSCEEAPRDGGPAYAAMLVKLGSEVLAVKELTSTAGRVDEQELLFEVPTTSDPDSGLEFFFRMFGTAMVTLRRLNIEAIESKLEHCSPAVLGLGNWLPFLRTGTGASTDGGTIVVSGSIEEFAVYGPYWTLPAGRYELHVVVVPHPSSRDRNAVVTAQVTGEEGTHIFGECRLRLSQYELTDMAGGIEFRLPFSLSSDLSATARTIETRIFTPGDVGFRILSLSVLAASEEFARDWFPYLAVEECGIHKGSEIKNITGELGYVASTAPMAVLPGHYKLLSDISTACDLDGLSFELRSGSELFAIAGADGVGTQPLDFDVPTEFSGKPVQLRIRALAPVEFSIRGLAVERISADTDPKWRQRLARARFKARMTLAQTELRRGDLASIAKLFRLMAIGITSWMGRGGK